MAEVHEGWITELLAGVSKADKSQLIQLLSQVKHCLNEQSADDHE
jgi:hypothetical protein